jgi:hypothetical protein
MDMTDALETAVLELKGKISERIAMLKDDANWRELQRLYSGLGVLEELCGMPKTDLGSLLDIGGTGASPKIAKYEFVSDTPLDAAKKYLRLISPKQKAASLDEILAALESGGLQPNRDELRISLSRSTTEIYKAGEDVYGLLENFPNVRRGTPGRRKNANGSTATAVEEIMKTQAPISLAKAVQQAEAASEAASEE